MCIGIEALNTTLSIRVQSSNQQLVNMTMPISTARRS